MRRRIRQRRERRIWVFGIIMVGIIFSIVWGSTTTANAGTATYGRYKYYTSIRITEGSSLWKIADTYMTEEYKSEEEYIKEVKQINHITGDLLYEGSYLCIPYYSAEYK